MSEPVQISRDPFARETLVRFTEEARGSCVWCGSRRMTRDGKPKARMFFYRCDGDGGRTSAKFGPYCSVSCFRIFSGEA